MSLKRNSTGVIEIEVQEPLENIEALEFIFKPKPDHTAPTLLELKYKKDEIPVKEDSDTTESTTVRLKLSPSETYKLTQGTVYMDTRIVLVDGDIPVTELVVISGVEESLFEGVYGSD